MKIRRFAGCAFVASTISHLLSWRTRNQGAYFTYELEGSSVNAFWKGAEIAFLAGAVAFLAIVPIFGETAVRGAQTKNLSNAKDGRPPQKFTPPITTVVFQCI